MHNTYTSFNMSFHGIVACPCWQREQIRIPAALLGKVAIAGFRHVTVDAAHASDPLVQQALHDWDMSCEHGTRGLLQQDMGNWDWLIHLKLALSSDPEQRFTRLIDALPATMHARTSADQARRLTREIERALVIEKFGMTSRLIDTSNQSVVCEVVHGARTSLAHGPEHSLCMDARGVYVRNNAKLAALGVTIADPSYHDTSSQFLEQVLMPGPSGQIWRKLTKRCIDDQPSDVTLEWNDHAFARPEDPAEEAAVEFRSRDFEQSFIPPPPGNFGIMKRFRLRDLDSGRQTFSAAAFGMLLNGMRIDGETVPYGSVKTLTPRRYTVLDAPCDMSDFRPLLEQVMSLCMLAVEHQTEVYWE